MRKLLGACLLLVTITVMQSKVFAATKSLNCVFNEESVEGVNSIKLTDETLTLNKELDIPLEKSTIRCANFGRQTRLDGNALGYQVILESCTAGVVMKGNLIDSVNGIAAPVVCNEI